MASEGHSNQPSDPSNPFYWTELSGYIQDSIRDNLDQAGLPNVTVLEYLTMSCVGLGTVLSAIFSTNQMIAIDNQIIRYATGYSKLLAAEKVTNDLDVEGAIIDLNKWADAQQPPDADTAAA